MRRRACRLSSPSPPASTPQSLTSGSSTKPEKIPIALLPPPTQAITSLGRRPYRSSVCRARLDADDLLQLAHHIRIRMRADDAADHVERVLDAGCPHAKRLVGRILERLGSALHRMHVRAEQTHHVHVERLALDVSRAHIDVDRYAELRADRRGRDAVLTGAGLREQPAFAHPPREQAPARRCC